MIAGSCLTCTLQGRLGVRCRIRIWHLHQKIRLWADCKREQAIFGDRGITFSPRFKHNGFIHEKLRLKPTRFRRFPMGSDSDRSFSRIKRFCGSRSGDDRRSRLCLAPTGLHMVAKFELRKPGRKPKASQVTSASLILRTHVQFVQTPAKAASGRFSSSANRAGRFPDHCAGVLRSSNSNASGVLAQFVLCAISRSPPYA
jgi:hypothetical protein